LIGGLAAHVHLPLLVRFGASSALRWATYVAAVAIALPDLSRTAWILSARRGRRAAAAAGCGTGASVSDARACRAVRRRR
jgi:hypothetical protein